MDVINGDGLVVCPVESMLGVPAADNKVGSPRRPPRHAGRYHLPTRRTKPKIAGSFLVYIDTICLKPQYLMAQAVVAVPLWRYPEGNAPLVHITVRPGMSGGVAEPGSARERHHVRRPRPVPVSLHDGRRSKDRRGPLGHTRGESNFALVKPECWDCWSQRTYHTHPV